MQDTIKRLSDLIAIDSQSHNGNKDIIRLLAQWFAQYKSTLQQWKRADGVEGQNLVIKIPGKKQSQSLVFIGHTDTVPTSKQWEIDPFQLIEKNGKLYGLGSCDTKGGIAALISSLFSLKEKPAYDTYIIFDGDEEVSATGAQAFLKTVSLPSPHFIFLEPTDNQVAIGMRSILQMIITTHGTATHSSQATPENNKKNNAIYKMHKILSALSIDADEYAKNIDQVYGITTQNFGIIQGGTAMNVFADDCSLILERRCLPNIDLQKEFTHVQELVTKIDSDAMIRRDQALPSFSLSKSNTFAQSVLSEAQEIIPSIAFGIFPAWSEAGLFADRGDVVILGPGSLVHQAHRANEYIEKKELLQFVGVFRNILTGMEL
ncbi:MAG TPA: M20/M25/M40 family metallo-hydrolase [Patescibacteria group bacterium]|nr:M20/M25/M40 family metallo-hydrolase [Patescibacteria group bacterium]